MMAQGVYTWKMMEGFGRAVVASSLTAEDHEMRMSATPVRNVISVNYNQDYSEITTIK